MSYWRLVRPHGPVMWVKFSTEAGWNVPGFGTTVVLGCFSSTTRSSQTVLGLSAHMTQAQREEGQTRQTL